jgi:heat shock protein HslJ
MKSIVAVLPVAVLFTFCHSAKSTQTASTAGSSSQSAAKRLNLPDRTDTLSPSSDTVVITGAEYIPLEGMSPTGTPADLEGSWVLDSLNGAKVPGKSNLNVDLSAKKLPEGTEIRHDSTIRKDTIKGVPYTTTTVLIDRPGEQAPRITPPQGSNFHVPDKPTINFFGSNQTFSGFTGCNRFSGRYSVGGKNSISLQNATASTKMVCLGDYDEDTYLNTLRRVNAFRAANGQLELMDGDKVILVFSKKTESATRR